MFTKEYFAERLRVERARRKLTQRELAEKVGVSKDSIRIWEDENDATVPGFATVCELADVLGCNVDDFACHPQEAVA